MVLASPLSRVARAIEDPMRPMPISASFSNMLLVLCPRRPERLQYLNQPAHRRFRPDGNAQSVVDAIDADLAHDQAFGKQRLERRLAGLGRVEQRQHEIALARHYPDGVAVERLGQPVAPLLVVVSQ